MNPPGRTTEEITIPQQIALLASMRAVHAAFSWFQIHENELRKLQLEVARIPAPPFEEAQRAKWLFDKFTGIGLEQIEIDEIGNVLAVLPGVDRELPATAIGAHLDTVFPPETEIHIHEERDRISGPGVSDNAAGLVAMLAIPMAMREAKISPESDILFIGNVGEEGEGDLRGIRHIFEKSRWKDRIDETIIIDGSGTDSIIGQALGSRRFEVIERDRKSVV